MRSTLLAITVSLLALTAYAPAAWASDCANLPDHTELTAALKTARAEANGGLNLDMWATIVDRGGVVCAVTFSGLTYIRNSHKCDYSYYFNLFKICQ